MSQLFIDSNAECLKNSTQCIIPLTRGDAPFNDRTQLTSCLDGIALACCHYRTCNTAAGSFFAVAVEQVSKLALGKARQ